MNQYRIVYLGTKRLHVWNGEAASAKEFLIACIINDINSLSWRKLLQLVDGGWAVVEEYA